MARSDRFDAIKADLNKGFVSRDPVARTEIHSKTVKHDGKGCAWCGGSTANGNLKQYHIETDGGSKHPIEGKFCSKNCMETYHG